MRKSITRVCPSWSLNTATPAFGPWSSNVATFAVPPKSAAVATTALEEPWKSMSRLVTGSSSPGRYSLSARPTVRSLGLRQARRSDHRRPRSSARGSVPRHRRSAPEARRRPLRLCRQTSLRADARLIRAWLLENANEPFSAFTWARDFAPELSALASATRDACFCKARNSGSNCSMDTAMTTDDGTRGLTASPNAHAPRSRPSGLRRAGHRRDLLRPQPPRALAPEARKPAWREAGFRIAGAGFEPATFGL